MRSDVVRARVSSELKHDSEEILNQMGMSMSDAIRIFL
ncbi:type II toxin-antitoxin system antitoxin, RelB/DinJ family, partial [Vibrio algivorus]